MNRYSFACLVLVMMFLHSCKKYDAFGREIKFTELYKAHWLLGDWQMEDSLGVLTESWKSIDDSTYTGQTLYIKNKKDTIHFETMQLMQDGDLLLYSSMVKGENDNQSISYKLIEDNDSLLVFENPKHDYPKTIRYQKESKTKSIQITITGKQHSKETKDSYLLKEIPK